MVLDDSSLEPSTNTDTWDSPDLNSRYASMFPLQIKRQYLLQPNAFLLYAGFAGPWNWERTVMYRISSHLEMARGLLRRDPTQPELDAIVEHTSRELNTRRTGLPIGVTAGSVHAYYTLRKHLNIPAKTSLFESLQTAWKLAPAPDRRQAIFQSGLRLGVWMMVTLGNFAALASYQFTVAVSADPRLAEFRDVIRRFAEARMQKLEAYRDRTRQRREDRDASRHATASAEEPSEFTDSQVAEAQTNAVYGNGQWQTQTPSKSRDTTSSSYYYSSPSSSSSSPPPPSSSSSSSPQDFFDDASPTAPEYQTPAASQASPSSNENAWDRIRRDNSSRQRSQPYNWGQQQAASAPSAQSQSSSGGADFSSYASEEQKGQRERDAAQRDFDRMLESERKLSRDGGGGRW